MKIRSTPLTLERREYLATQESERKCYMAYLEKGKEQFYTYDDTSYGKGKTWRLTPDDRRHLDVEFLYPFPKTLESEEVTDKRAKKNVDAYGVINAPEYLMRLDAALRRHVNESDGALTLPDDAIVARCQLNHGVRESPDNKQDLEVLVLSELFDEIGLVNRHPDLFKKKRFGGFTVRSKSIVLERSTKEFPWFGLIEAHPDNRATDRIVQLSVGGENTFLSAEEARTLRDWLTKELDKGGN